MSLDVKLGLKKDKFYGVCLGLTSRAEDISGGQISVFHNDAKQMSGGFQISSFFNEGDDIDYALEAGMINGGNLMKGAQIGVLNMSEEIKGFQGGLANLVDDVYGVQVGVINHSAFKTRGVQIGAYNQADDLKGVQNGLVNLAKGWIKGVQMGCVNISKDDLRGIQAGLVCYAEDGKYAQIGLLTIRKVNGKKQITPLFGFRR